MRPPREIKAAIIEKVKPSFFLGVFTLKTKLPNFHLIRHQVMMVIEIRNSETPIVLSMHSPPGTVLFVPIFSRVSRSMPKGTPSAKIAFLVSTSTIFRIILSVSCLCRRFQLGTERTVPGVPVFLFGAEGFGGVFFCGHFCRDQPPQHGQEDAYRHQPQGMQGVKLGDIFQFGELIENDIGG